MRARLVHVLRRPALLAALLLLPMCHLNCPASDEGLPPPVDGGADDAGGEPDATPAQDARGDRGTADAGSGEWLVMPGVPEGCAARMARDPAALHPPLSFEPCPDKPGCRQLVMDWVADEYGRVAILGFDQTGWHDGTRGYVVFRRPAPDVTTPGAYWTILAADDGEIVALWSHRFPRDDATFCYLGRVVVGEGRYVVDVFNENTYERWIVGGELADPVGTVRLAGVLSELGADVNFVRAGRDHIAVQTTAYQVFRLGWDGAVRRIEDASGTPPDADAPTPVGAATVFNSWAASNRILISLGGAPPEELVPPPEPAAEPSIHATMDGQTLAWLTGITRRGGSPIRFEAVELWASPYAERMEDLSPVRLGTMNHRSVHGALWAGSGHAAVMDADSEGETVIRLFRVSDGFETVLRPPPGLLWTGEIPYIGPREVVLGAGTQPRAQTAIQFVDHTALEPAL